MAQGEAMRLKHFKICILIAFCAIIFCACGALATVKTQGDTYDVTDVKFAGSIDGRQPESGMSFLLVTLKGDNADMEDMEKSFFNYERSPSRVSDGSFSALAKSAAYTQDKNGVSVTLVFEVPPTFKEEFTFTGDTFGIVTLKGKKEK